MRILSKEKIRKQEKKFTRKIETSVLENLYRPNMCLNHPRTSIGTGNQSRKEAGRGDGDLLVYRRSRSQAGLWDLWEKDRRST